MAPPTNPHFGYKPLRLTRSLTVRRTHAGTVKDIRSGTDLMVISDRVDPTVSSVAALLSTFQSARVKLTGAGYDKCRLHLDCCDGTPRLRLLARRDGQNIELPSPNEGGRGLTLHNSRPEHLAASVNALVASALAAATPDRPHRLEALLRAEQVRLETSRRR